MNVLLVTGIFAQNKKDEALGGMPKAVYMTADGLLKRGNSVKILTVGDNNREWKYRNIDVISVSAQDFLNTEKELQMAYAILKREISFEMAIIKINRKWKIDIIQYAGWFGVGLLHGGKIPAVMRISSYTKAQLKFDYAQKRIKVLSFLECMAAKRMDVIFSPSNVMAEALGKDVKRKIRVIETPYIQEIVQEDNKVYEQKLKGKQYFLFFGRMTPDKGIFVIRDILYRVLEQHKALFFVFASLDNERQVIKQIMSEAGEYKNRIIFLGKLSHSLLFPVIRRAEAIVMPSLMDNFPNACAEAMSLGSIVIGTVGSSLEQFITDGHNGFLAKRGDSDSLLEQIERCLALEEKQKELMKINALNRLEQLKPDIYFGKLEKIYGRLINRKEDREKNKWKERLCYIQRESN